MKRPQSAKQPHHYNYCHMASDEGQYNRKKAFPIQNKNLGPTSSDLSRLLPKHIHHDKERLYHETLQLKKSLNHLTDENLRLKTKVAVLDKDRYREKDQERGRRTDDLGLRKGADNDNAKLNSLKRLVRESKAESENSRAELTRLKRTLRFTKVNEIELERQTVYQENMRLASLVGQLQTQIQSTGRHNQKVEALQSELRLRNQELQQVSQDNGKYEELLQELSLANRELNQKAEGLERKMKQDLGIEKRRVQQLIKSNQQLQVIKSNQQLQLIKSNQQRAEEERRNTKKKVVRPNSSSPHCSKPINAVNSQKTKDKVAALELNTQLLKELQEARDKLTDSENKLKRRGDQSQKKKQQNRESAAEETFELELTKQEQTNFYEQLEGADLHLSSREHFRSSEEGLAQGQIRGILTDRMKYNRYTFAELQADIEGSPNQTFTSKNLVLMLTGEPFYLTRPQAAQFLKLLDPSQNSSISAAVLIEGLRKVIDQFQLAGEEEEEQMLYRIADFMTKRRVAIEAELGKLGVVGQLATKAQLQQALGLFGDLGEDEIDLAICYASPTSESLLKINFCDLLDKFQVSREESYGPASREGTGEVEREDEIEQVEKETDEALDEEELSFGQNEEVDSLSEGEKREENQLI